MIVRDSPIHQDHVEKYSRSDKTTSLDAFKSTPVPSRHWIYRAVGNVARVF